MTMENFGEIQIRPPVTEKEEIAYEKRERKTEERRESDWVRDVESAGSFLSRVTKDGVPYSETIALDSEGNIDRNTFMDNAGRTLLESAKSVDISKDGLEKLLDGIREKYKNLDLSLEQDENKIVLSVENKVKKGIFAQWTSQGVQQWQEARRIVHVSDDGQYAFFDGSMTGVPVEQLEIAG